MSSLVITPGTLWTLRVGTPKAALRIAESVPRDGIPRDIDPSTAADDFWETFEARRPREGDPELILRVSVERLPFKQANVCRATVNARRDASPSNVREIVRRTGLHMMFAMAKEVAWTSQQRPFDEFVLIARQDDGDEATYQLSEEIMEAGQIEYRRALASLDQAVRDGWPGWREMGVQQL